MAYQIYNMGLAVPVSSQRLLTKRKVLPLSKQANSPGIGDSENEERVDVIDTLDQHKPANVFGSAYKQAEQHNRQPVYQADQIMSSPVVTLPTKMPLAEARSIFLQKQFRHFLVTDESGLLIGIVSDRDVLSKTTEQVLNGKPQPATINQVMSKSVLTASATTSIQEICQVMFNQHIGALPITSDNGEVLGLVTRSDILRSMIEHGPLELWI